jgi:hypothetical protein
MSIATADGWRTLVVTSSALPLGQTFAHVLELPQRRAYDAELWTSLTEPNASYRFFGVIGGPLEVAADVGAVVLTVVRRRRALARRALGAAVLHAAALAVWLTVVLPANIEIDSWSSAGIPADWQTWSNRWETGHAVRFGLLLAGFCLLVLPVLAEQRRGGRERPVDQRRYAERAALSSADGRVGVARRRAAGHSQDL